MLDRVDYELHRYPDDGAFAAQTTDGAWIRVKRNPDMRDGLAVYVLADDDVSGEYVRTGHGELALLPLVAAAAAEQGVPVGQLLESWHGGTGA
jgi:hypothetical protein